MAFRLTFRPVAVACRAPRRDRLGVIAVPGRAARLALVLRCRQRGTRCGSGLARLPAPRSASGTVGRSGSRGTREPSGTGAPPATRPPTGQPPGRVGTEPPAIIHLARASSRGFAVGFLFCVGQPSSGLLREQGGYEVGLRTPNASPLSMRRRGHIRRFVVQPLGTKPPVPRVRRRPQ